MIVLGEGLSRALPPPFKAVPRWLARCPSQERSRRAPETEETTPRWTTRTSDDEIDDDSRRTRAATLHEVSFDLRPAKGSGSSAPTATAIATIGSHPDRRHAAVDRPRGRSAARRADHESELRRLIGNTSERKSVTSMGRYFHWPLAVIKARWDEIEEFAGLHGRRASRTSGSRQRTRRLAHLGGAAHGRDALRDRLRASMTTPRSAVRCLDLVAQRKAEGAAVIQAARRWSEAVAGLSDQVIWIEDGDVVYRGRPVDVAAEVHRNTRREGGSASGARHRRCVTDGEPVQFGRGPWQARLRGALLRKDIEIGSTLELTDERRPGGRAAQSRARGGSESLGSSSSASASRPALLDEPSYHAQADRSEIAIVGHEPAPPRELVSFDIAVAPGSRSAATTSRGLGAPADRRRGARSLAGRRRVGREPCKRLRRPCRPPSRPLPQGRRRRSSASCSSWSTSAATCGSSTR